MKRLIVSLAMLGLLGASLGATAGTTVYRCGPDGRSYSDQPCPQGRAVEVGDERSAEQRADAERIAQRERALAEAMRRERLALEAARAPVAAAKAGRSKPRPVAKAAARKPRAAGDDGVRVAFSRPAPAPKR
jgi:hypothetical protein